MQPKAILDRLGAVPQGEKFRSFGQEAEFGMKLEQVEKEEKNVRGRQVMPSPRCMPAQR
jgi:hypothetical protein